MAFDGFIMNTVISELKPNILDGKINKIYSPTKNDILFNLYNCGKTYNLLINTSSDNCRICTTNYQRKNPNSPSNFCMLLRKHLTGSRIIQISTFGLERVLEIVFEGYSEHSGIITKKIFAEIMNRYSNIILTDEKNNIIGSLKYTDMKSYTLPKSPKYDILNINSFAEFMNIIQKSESEDLIVKISDSFIGTSRSLITNILLEKNINPTNYSEENLKQVFDYLHKLISRNLSDLYCKEFSFNNKLDYVLSLQKTSNTIFNSYIDTFYFNKENVEVFKAEKYQLEKIVLNNLKKCKKKLENIESKLNDCKNMDIYRIYGELLNTNSYKLGDFHTNLVELENYYDNNKTIKIPLDISLSIRKNADKYFKKYKKLKNASQIVIGQKEEALQELVYLESVMFSINMSTTIEDLFEIKSEIQDSINPKKFNQSSSKNFSSKKKADAVLNIEKLNIDDYSVYIGKNNKQNEYLTLKFANRNDIWFHVQNLSGSHIILKTNNQDLTDNIIYKCAELAKKYSKGANDLNVCVDYTLVKNIKKMPGGKTGMVIYNIYKTIII